MGVKHLFESEIADGPDDTVVRPSDWNADHEIETSAVTPTTLDKILLLDESNSDALAHSLVSALVTLIFASPAFSGNPTTPNQSAASNNTRVANTAYVDAAIAALIGTAPGTLDTLGEISDAINDDANLYTTLVSIINGKVDDTAYDATSWNGDTTHAPSKNAIRDKIEAIVAGSAAISDTVFGVGWNGDTTNGASKNALYDFLITLATLADPAFTGNPTAPTQSALNNSTRIATTAYVEAAVAAALAGLKWKNSVRVATTANGTLASAFENGDTVDGVTLATGDRILIKDQSSATENGIYVVAASGAPARASDADAGSELVNATVFVEAGTANADKMFVCTNNQTPTLGVTNITFTQFSSGGGTVDDTAYNESTWNGDTTNAPSKNAVRDILETRNPIGKQSIYIPASAMVSAAASGASTAIVATASFFLNYAVLDFDGSGAEFAHFQVAFPKSWDEATVTFKAFWATANTGTAGVAIGLAGAAVSDGDTIDATFGTAVYVTDAGQSSAAKQYVTAESAAVTISGTPAEGDLVYFRVNRNPADAADTMTEDLRLIGIQLFFTTNAVNDA